MILPKIPKSMAKQSVLLKLRTGETDSWGKEKYRDVQVNNCVVQLQTIYSGTNNNRSIVANGVIFFYFGITSPWIHLDRDAVGSKLMFEDKEYTITRVIDNRDPFGNEVWSYEVEVL